MPRKKRPKPSAAKPASPIDTRLADRHSGSGSRATSTVPTIPSPTPASCSALGCSPFSRPPMTATSTPRAPIVATTLTDPSAIAR
jgi:hypothetical protein